MAGLLLGAVIAPTVAWYVAMIGSLLVLLSIEFLNTAIEKLSDHVTPEHHIQIGRIKDYGSAGVFCGICLCGLIWLAALAVRLRVALRASPAATADFFGRISAQEPFLSFVSRGF